MRRFSLIPLVFLFVASSVFADWTEVRDLVRKGDGETSNGVREKTYRKAYAIAQKSARENPNVSNEYLWLANAAGRIGQLASTQEKIEMSQVVKENAIRAISLDPKNGGAYMTLGAWHFYVADLSWVERAAAKVLYGGLPPASFKEAVKNLTKALEFGAENPVEIYYLRGRAYKELDMTAEAGSDFYSCMEGKARNAEERRMQKEAKDLLH
jgi:tetratricopeptide (TPR) repeat protein